MRDLGKQNIRKMLDYYTTKSLQKQAKMDKIPIFVYYDHFYVNIIM